MKGLIITREADLSWASGVGLGHNWFIEMLGLSLLEQNLTFLRDRGYGEIRVLSDHGTEALEKRFSQFEGLTIRTFLPGRGILDLMVSQAPFWSGQGGVVIPGPVFLGHSGQGATYSGFSPLVFEKSRLIPWEDCGPWTTLSTALDYHLTVMEKLKSLGASEVWKGAGVKIHGQAVVGPLAALGAGVRIDRDAEVVQTLVGSGVHVGRGVVLREKIVLGNWIIEPRKGTRTLINDRSILKYQPTMLL